jgi:hypothetical protein
MIDSRDFKGQPSPSPEARQQPYLALPCLKRG